MSTWLAQAGGDKKGQAARPASRRMRVSSRSERAQHAGGWEAAAHLPSNALLCSKQLLEVYKGQLGEVANHQVGRPQLIHRLPPRQRNALHADLRAGRRGRTASQVGGRQQRPQLGWV